MTPSQIAAALRERGTDPLGAACGDPRVPYPSWGLAHALIGVDYSAAIDIAMDWDFGRPVESVRLAIAIGLGPKIEAFLNERGVPERARRF